MGKKFKKNNSLQKKNYKNNRFNTQDKKSTIKSTKTKRKKTETPKNKRTKSTKFMNFPEIKKEKKIKLKPLKYLFIQPNKDIKKMSINKLKEFVDKFDINPEANYQLLSYLQKNEAIEYNKYILKYRYTLHFENALSLNCFDIKNIINVLNEYNSNMDNYKSKSTKVNSIKNINSFSRIKLFNLFFFLLEGDFRNMENDEIIQKLLSYSIQETLIFKIPNKYGSIELKYYSNLIILVNMLLQYFNINNNSIITQVFSSSSNKDIIFFNFKNKPRPQRKEVDLEEFYQRKNLLNKYLIGLNAKEKNENTIDVNTKVFKRKDFYKKISIIRTFKKNILELTNLKDDVAILERISFIIKCILFFEKEDLVLKAYSNCLKINNNDNTTTNKKNSNKYAIENIDILFDSNSKNPFNNNSEYFLFPVLLKKNKIQSDEELFISFKNFLKYIYKSKIIKDIFYLTSEFEEFLYPFEDEEILDELFEMITFLPFPNYILMGYTQKEFPEILISTNLTNPDSDFSKKVCDYSQILNACIQEHLNNYMKALIFYNYFQYGKSKNLNYNFLELNEERKIIKSILYKNKNQNNFLSLDDGEKTEIFLYGNILGKIHFSQALELFKLSNWNKTTPQHIEDFIKSGKKNKGSKMVKLEQIEKNDDFCKFFKILAKKYKQYIKNDEELGTNIKFNYTSYSAKIPRHKINNEPEGYIMFDYSCYSQCHRTIVDTNM